MAHQLCSLLKGATKNTFGKKTAASSSSSSSPAKADRSSLRDMLAVSIGSRVRSRLQSVE